jgi:hypothetical protein
MREDLRDEWKFRSKFTKDPWDEVSKRVGSVFKKCRKCGSFDVRKAHTPNWIGWEYYCVSCSGKDDECWKPSKTILRKRGGGKGRQVTEQERLERVERVMAGFNKEEVR